MYEYKSEIVSIIPESKGKIKFVMSVADYTELAKFDELINSHAAEGWELATHSAIVDATVGRINILATFRRQK